ELGGEDEQRNGQQHVARVHAVEKLLGGGAHVEAGEVEVQHRPADHRVPDREPEQAETDDRGDAQGERARRIHRPELTLSGSGAAWALPRARLQRIQAYRTMMAAAKRM